MLMIINPYSLGTLILVPDSSLEPLGDPWDRLGWRVIQLPKGVRERTWWV
jgi:hypothetical protein